MKKIIRVDNDIVRVEDYIELTDNLVIKVNKKLSRLYLFKNSNIEVDGSEMGIIGDRNSIGIYVGVKSTYILPENLLNEDYVIYYKNPMGYKITYNGEVDSWVPCKLKNVWSIREIWKELKVNKGNKG